MITAVERGFGHARCQSSARGRGPYLRSRRWSDISSHAALLTYGHHRSTVGMTRIFIIGIGYKPLDKKVTRDRPEIGNLYLRPAGSWNVFSRYEEYDVGKRKNSAVIDNIGETLNFMKVALNGDETSTITLLASGDPMFFGIGRRYWKISGKTFAKSCGHVQYATGICTYQRTMDDALLIEPPRGA